MTSTHSVAARAAGAAILLGMLVAACSASTQVVRSWIAPEFKPGAVKKVFVVGVSQDPSLRRLYEDSFAVEINERGAAAVSSYTMLPDLGKVDKKVVGAMLLHDGCTHVLVTRMVKVEDKETYYPPTTVSVGYGGYPGWYGGWYPYMSVSYGYVTTPGYTTVQQVVGLETNVYDLASEKMIYSGMTETWLSDVPASHIPEVISALSWDLRAKHVL